MTSIEVVNKDQAFLEWASRYSKLPDSLVFQFLSSKVGSCAIVPIQGEAVVKRYISGGAVCKYDFALQVNLEISDTTDTTNTDNMYMQRQWAQWIMDRQAERDFPDFGPKCRGYRLELLSNMPTPAQINEDRTGKYQFFARLNYKEDA